MILDDFSSPVGDFNQVYWDRSIQYPRFFAKSNPFEANALFANNLALRTNQKPLKFIGLEEGRKAYPNKPATETSTIKLCRQHFDVAKPIPINLQLKHAGLALSLPSAKSQSLSQ